MSSRSRARAYTLVETVFTLTIVATVAMAAIPLFGTLAKARIITLAGSLVTDLNFARGEAIRRRASVALCASADGAGCRADATWEGGWIVYPDLNENRRRDQEETLLRVHEATMAVSVQFAGSLNRDTELRYRADGRVTPNGTFTICAEEGRQARGVVILQTGRARVRSLTPSERRQKCTRVI